MEEFLKNDWRPSMSLDVLAIAAHPDDVEQTCGGTLITDGGDGVSHGRARSDRRATWARAARPNSGWRKPSIAASICCSDGGGNLHFPDARLENTISARMTLAVKIRELKPRVVILPYWEARHPDHYRAGELGYEAAFLAGLKKLDEYSEPHRPFKILYSALYADVTPSFVVDISAQFERRMKALLATDRSMGRARRARPVSERAGDPREARRDRAVLRQSDRGELWRAVRRKGNYARRRHRFSGRTEHLIVQNPPSDVYYGRT